MAYHSCNQQTNVSLNNQVLCMRYTAWPGPSPAPCSCEGVLQACVHCNFLSTAAITVAGPATGAPPQLMRQRGPPDSTLPSGRWGPDQQILPVRSLSGHPGPDQSFCFWTRETYDLQYGLRGARCETRQGTVARGLSNPARETLGAPSRITGVPPPTHIAFMGGRELAHGGQRGKQK